MCSCDMFISVIVVPIQCLNIADFAEAFPSDDMRRNEGVPSTPSVGIDSQSDGLYTIRSPNRPHVSSVMQRFTAGRQFEACPGSYQGKHVHDACFRSFEATMPQERARASSLASFP